MSKQSVTRPATLSEAEYVELVRQLRELADAQLPLAEGLRDVAHEIRSKRLRRSLRQLADSFAQAQPVDQAIGAHTNLPAFVTRLLSTGLQSGQLGAVLANLVDYFQLTQRVRRRIRLTLSYPILLFLMLGGIATLIVLVVLPTLQATSTDFGTELPRATKSLLWLAREGWIHLVGWLAATSAALAAYRVIVGRATWARVVSTTPVVGQLIHLTGFVQFSRLLSILLQNQVPLPQALQLTADGTNNAFVSSIALDVAHSVAQGASFADSLAAHDGVPHALLPLAETGELHNDIATAMRTGSQVLEGQLMNRSELLEQVLPPVCFILVGGFALTLLLAVFLPLMSLVSNLQ